MNGTTDTNGQFNGQITDSPAELHTQTDTTAHENAHHEDEEEEAEQPSLSVPMTIGLLAVVTVVRSLLSFFGKVLNCFWQIVAVTAEFLVDSINGLTSTGNISKEFVGLVLLPIVGNAAGAWPLPDQMAQLHWLTFHLQSTSLRSPSLSRTRLISVWVSQSVRVS